MKRIVTDRMLTQVYHLKIKQEYYGTKSEFDYVFKSSAQVYMYLLDLWEYWEKSLSPEDWDRLPPTPTIGELKAGLNGHYSSLTGFETYEILGHGFITGDETFSIVMILSRMPVY